MGRTTETNKRENWRQLLKENERGTQAHEDEEEEEEEEVGGKWKGGTGQSVGGHVASNVVLTLSLFERSGYMPFQNPARPDPTRPSAPQLPT